MCVKLVEVSVIFGLSSGLKLLVFSLVTIQNGSDRS